MWQEVRELQRQREQAGGKVTVVWIKGHGKAQRLQERILAWEDMVANYVADVFACVAAESSGTKVVPKESLAYFWSLSTVRKVQARLLQVAALSTAAHEEKKRQGKTEEKEHSSQQVKEAWLARAAREKNTTLEGHRLVSPHCLVMIDNKYFCTECLGWQPKEKTAGIEWRRDCTPAGDM
jgi:hypothetical protein